MEAHACCTGSVAKPANSKALAPPLNNMAADAADAPHLLLFSSQHCPDCQRLVPALVCNPTRWGARR